MSGVHVGVDDRLWLAVTLILTVLFHFLNRRPRLIVDRAVAPLRVPERMKGGYSADQLVAFGTRAHSVVTPTGRTALDLYRSIVLPIDVGFALALGLLSALLWEFIWPSIPPAPLLAWLGWIGPWASFAYLGFDLAEDVVLIRLLSPGRRIYAGQARIASTFTVCKLVFICVSVFGLIAFLALALIDCFIEVREEPVKS
ncbi:MULTISPECIES: hypothetical protein [unclassified Bradyrhizobium]|uniref:hypothetical protein n=1 Tax=unclassified Bradyrhizobium TaxID=2631580 RepID=UPI0028EFE8A8|nr:MULTISPECIES: hypothetical protein [unclassified Bradyrhizobium]